MEYKMKENYYHTHNCGELRLADQGKNPFTLDSKEPTADYKEFLLGETRYASLMKARPELAEQLFAKTEEDSKVRLANYKHLADK